METANMQSLNSPEEQVLHIPKKVTIETIFGCNASCTMCVIDAPTERKKGIMPLEMSNKIMEDLAPFNEQIQQLDLFALGEPMLDPFIFDRIKYAKKLGFRNVGISTNADLLLEDKQKKLLESGIDTVIFSIDGINAETHEAIRRKLKFERVMRNCLSTIKMRDEGNYKTRFLIRFIRQQSNKDQWETFKAFWLSKISLEKRDMMAVYDMHTWGGDLTTKDAVLKSLGMERSQVIESKPCQHYLDTLVILSDGTVPLCHEDILHGKYNFGNANTSSVIQIFNNAKRNAIRKLQLSGKKYLNKKCEECTVHYSEPMREFINA